MRLVMALNLLIFISQGPLAATGNESFRVSIEARKNTIQSYQKRAELKLARSTDFCRGFYLPKKIGSWQCKPVGAGKLKCVSKFKCGLVNKIFSRITESRRIRSELKKLPRDNRSFAMSVSKKPLRNPSKYRYVKEIKRKRQAAFNSQKAKIKRRIKQRTQRIKREMTEYDEFSKLEKELAIERSRTNPSMRKKSVDRFSSNGLEEDRRQIKESIEDIPPFRMERIKSNTSNEEIIKISKGTKEVPIDRKFQLFAFSGAMTQVQDDNENTIATIDFAWTPRWQFSRKWAARGRVGGHFISEEPIDGFDSETFLVYDLAAEAEYSLFDGGFYLSAGLGIQSWTSDAGGAFSTVSLGAGYLFEFNKLKVFDRLFVNYTTVGNEAANKELKVGFGVSF